MPANIDPNAQITGFLNYYFKIKAPKYAVMLKGPWGSGKTWFIEEQLKHLPTDQRTLYVSLYGVSSKSEIEDQFFEQLHPILAHKGTKVAGKILKGALKATLKIDLDNDGKSDGSVSVGVPDVNVADLLKNSKGGLNLIFDDVERCEIPHSQLFGYINYFVEHDQTRVVLLANEDEIIAKERRSAPAESQTKDEIQYLRVREKLIGKTFEVHPDLPRALSKFLEEVSDGDAKKALERERSLVADLHACSGYRNLRHLRQAVLDFDRLVGEIDATTRIEEMLRGILATFLVYTFEIRSGSLRADEIRTVDSWLALMKEDSRDVARELSQKYPPLKALDSVLPSELWARIMDTGLLDGEAIRAAVRQSKFVAKQDERPDWLQLWDAFSMEDVALSKLLAKAENRLRSCEYTVLGELMHIAGAMIGLSSIGVYATPARHIAKLALANVDQLPSEQLLSDEDDGLRRGSWAGRIFHGADRPEFKQFQAAVDKKQARAKVESYADKADQLLQALMRKDPSAFAGSIAWSNSGGGPLASEPILVKIEPKSFVQAIEVLSGSELAQIGLAFKRRYEGNRSELASERRWLNAVAKQLAPWRHQKGTLSGFYLRLLRQEVTRAAQGFSLTTVKKKLVSEDSEL
ncbi:P-loop NTPase fold protein [Variovorax sp. J22R115]|uniref:P-loop NTPase fold protein n=1 Tax=Variovorax sp. J22R115 TaxID=3053509 RepID=UPI002576837D|nr:P-loop NTPase fold protein [Variovorax sp. J22R115]MDM0048815.1 P-loop NTPase fold protein [Variovorax sp. J22R115]